MKNNRLAVCGDSCWSPTKKYPGTHFSEIICSKLNYELLPLSRSGSSNALICLQLEKAIQESADIVIFGCTFETRITLLDQEYHEPFELSNTFGSDDNDLSIDHIPVNHRNYTSASINDSMVEDFSKKHFTLNENYHTLSTQQSWMLAYWINRLQEEKIKFIFSSHYLTQHNSRAKNIFQKFQKHDINDIPYIYQDYTNDPGYHTHPESQKLIADQIIDKYKECYS